MKPHVAAPNPQVGMISQRSKECNKAREEINKTEMPQTIENANKSKIETVKCQQVISEQMQVAKPQAVTLSQTSIV